MKEKLYKCSSKQWHAYWAAETARMDYEDLIKGALNDGRAQVLAQGKAQGIAKGQAEGRAEEQKKFLAESKRKARNMFIRGISLEDALLFSPLKKSELKKLNGK